MYVLLFVVSLCGCRAGKQASAALNPTETLQVANVASASTRDGESTIELASYQSTPPQEDAVTQSAAEQATDVGQSEANTLVAPVVQQAPEPPVMAEPPVGALIQAAAVPLSLIEVLDSVARCYPEIEQAFNEIDEADGRIVASQGAFDSVLKAHTISQPLSFYQNYRNGVGLAKPLFRGGEVYGAYRIGDGDFEPWYGERETNEGGEFRAGFSLPLLQGRTVDKRRTDLRSAVAGRDQVSASVESRLLLFQRLATQAYWDWAASGRAVQIQQRLLDLALQRVEQIDKRVALGDLATIAKIDNERLIAERKVALIKARRSLEKAAIKLSIYYRNADCAPVIAEVQQLPFSLPDSQRIDLIQRDTDIATAIAVRPELAELQAERQRVCVELEYARNLILPKLDARGFASQDIGGAASSRGDKTPFELQLGLHADVPLQRRHALGKIQQAQAKLAQINAKSRLVTDKIRAEIQDAASAVNAAAEQIGQSLKNVELNSRALELGGVAFEAGNIDLIELNIRETALADARLKLLDAQFQYFFFRAVYETAVSGSATFR